MRKAVIAGNWKMHYTPDEAVKVIEELKPLVKDATCEVVICAPFVDLDAVIKAVLGHSERREYFNETDEALNKKVKVAFAHNLIPILCCGETLEQREGGVTNEVVGAQIKADLAGLDKELAEKVIIAYEPIWAIGTGKTATNEQANETIAAIRGIVAEMFGQEVADKVRIQYGGSVKPNTIKDQMAMSDIDGALVGGASLVATDFAQIVNY
ncbi:MAG: triose-phosphate isomerase [Clostridium sp.]|nr:triose-phosphate isomerase [Clostridium sp.]